MNPSNGPLPKPIAQRPRTGLDLLTLCALPAHSTASVPLPSSSYPSPSSLPSTSSFIQSFPPSPQTVLPPLSSLFLPCPPTVPSWPYPQHQGAFQPVFPSLHPCSSSSFPSSPFLFNPSSNSNPSFGANSLPSLSPSNSFPTLPPMTSASKATEQLPRPDDEEATTEDSASEENGPLSGPSAGSNPTNLEVKVPKKRGRRPKPPHEKRHPCELCQKEFKRMEHLRRHLLVHTGEKPFECPIPRCQRLFSRRDNLQQHYRTHSKEERDATSL